MMVTGRPALLLNLKYFPVSATHWDSFFIRKAIFKGYVRHLFLLANTHNWLGRITLRVRSHNQFHSKLVEQCYAETITHVILHVQGVHPNGTTLADGPSINLFTFLKSDPVTTSMYI